MELLAKSKYYLHERPCKFKEIRQLEMVFEGQSCLDVQRFNKKITFAFFFLQSKHDGLNSVAECTLLTSFAHIHKLDL